ncbi:hypothetical protein IPA_01975 [Ignicoccus pacificus DSM 13166]|uniref:Uncharacterized protein n=1 Tax=Ignicoccus pacificus DSM 13166 TaxID=940294 RepID=A0A977PKM1_9CREN|nr:hypothetical protein IPA_01975 [Ignicoccus pacificus DSM 13166]
MISPSDVARSDIIGSGNPEKLMEVLSKLIGKVKLSEAINITKEYITSLSKFEKEYWKKMREVLCKESELTDPDPLTNKILKVLRAQCSPKWENLNEDERALILAPLYHAIAKIKLLEELEDKKGKELLREIIEESLEEAEDYAIAYGVLDE